MIRWLNRWRLERKATRLGKHCQELSEEILVMVEMLEKYTSRYVELKARLARK